MIRTSIKTHKIPSYVELKIVKLCSRISLVVALTLMTIGPLIAQQGAGLLEKLAGVKKSAAENQQKLHQYQWIETPS